MRLALLLPYVFLAACTHSRPAATARPAGAPQTMRAAPGARASAHSTLAATPLLPAFPHIFIIVMENREFDQVVGNPKAPVINGLARRYGLATNYYAVAHPSLPNYLALIGGSTFGISSDCSGCRQKAPNLADQLEAHGRSWKAYMEDLPAPCSLTIASGRYALKHDPWLYFEDIRANQGRCRRVAPLTQLATDLQGGSLPDLVWITPNLCHDMHDCSVAAGDAWLGTVLPPLLASPAWQQGSVLFIVWDEGTSNAGCCGATGGGRVPLLVIAPQTAGGVRLATPVNHYALLRTIEDAWSLGRLGQAAAPETPSLAGFFTAGH